MACQQRTTLNQLFELLRELLAPAFPVARNCRPAHGDSRPGDVRHSLADISKAAWELGYAPTHTLADGLEEALAWYQTHLGAGAGK